MSEFIKITVMDQCLNDKPINFCIGNPDTFEDLKSRISNYLFKHLNLDKFEFALHWIDKDGDRIYIFEYSDYLIFSVTNIRRLFVTKIEQTTKDTGLQEGSATSSTNVKSQQQTTSSSTSSPNENSKNRREVHRNVSCDACFVSPIVGHRYKCLKCFDYDLCANCEASNEHPNHIMVRLPKDIRGTPEFNTLFRSGSYFKCRDENGHHKSGKERSGKERHHRHSRHGRSFPPLFFTLLDSVDDAGDSNPNEDEVPKTTSSQNTNQSQYNEMPQNNETTSNIYPNVDQFKTADIFAATLAAENAAAIASKVAASATNAIFGINKTEPYVPTANKSDTAEKPSTSSNDANNSTESTNKAEDKGKENTGKEKSTSSSTPITPITPALDFHNLMNFVDPRYVRNGIQILNNFSDMFAKMLDPIDGEGCNFSTSNSNSNSNSNSQNGSRKCSSSASSADSNASSLLATGGGTKDVTTSTVPTKTSEVGTATTTTKTSDVSTTTTKASTSEVATATLILPTTEVGTATNNTLTSEASTATNVTVTTEVATGTSSETIDTISNSVDVKAGDENLKADDDLLLLAADSLNSSGAEGFDNKTPPRRSQCEENDWQLINIEGLEKEKEKNSDNSIKNIIKNVANQETNTDPTSVDVGTYTPRDNSVETNNPNKTTVYHADPNINKSVIAMMAMGFSNEGGWLTHLLESVHGNIPEVLDIMNIAQTPRQDNP